MHFWVMTIGVVFYIAAMWISGVLQGLMWRAVNADGTLTYSFVESVEAMYPFYFVRFLGGVWCWQACLSWLTTSGKPLRMPNLLTTRFPL